MFLADTGKKILSSIIVKAHKVRATPRPVQITQRYLSFCARVTLLCLLLQSPKRFEEVFEEMISFLEHTEHWEDTEVELATRGVSVARQ